MALEPQRFSESTLALIESAENDLFLSAASVWEIAVKYATRRLPMPIPPSDYIQARLSQSRTEPLAITHAHALRSAELPRHHRDPFDRVLVAQAQVERLGLVTSDPKLRRYDVDLIEA